MPNLIYTEYFFKNALFNKLKEDGYVVNTPYRKTVSQNSFCLKTSLEQSNTEEYKNHVLEVIKKVFGITNPLFDEKFHKAVNGAGQEWNEINRLHSSALVPLLFFYSVSDTNPLTILIDGHECVFTSSEFEVDNCIGKNRKNNDFCSHIDVLLLGKCGDKTVSLYLESKFGEYINQRGDEKGIPRIKEYNDIYTLLRNKIEGIRINLNEDTIDIIQINKKPYSFYCQGIKQMICHYLGMKNRTVKCDMSYLGEILFDFRPYINSPDYFLMYESIHDKLVQALNEVRTSDIDFQILPRLLSYKEIFKNFNIDSNVAELYK